MSRRRKYEDVTIVLESGGEVYVRARFNLVRLTKNDRLLLNAIADANCRQRDRCLPAAVADREGTR